MEFSRTLTIIRWLYYYKNQKIKAKKRFLYGESKKMK